jgi:hypothetical protein
MMIGSPMDSTGFGSLLGSLLKVREQQPVGTPLVERVSIVETPPSDEVEDESAALPLDAQWLEGESDEETTQGPVEDEDVGLNPPGLEVEAWELKYMRSLAPLIGSPRMAKRFANVYRFIRAGLSGAELDAFRGTATEPGTFRAVSLLLALLTGFPGETVELFRRLLSDPPDLAEQWPAFVRRVASEKPGADANPATGHLARRWDRLLTALLQVEVDVGVSGEMEVYREWAPRVARFSFQTGQILARRGP